MLRAPWNYAAATHPELRIRYAPAERMLRGGTASDSLVMVCAAGLSQDCAEKGRREWGHVRSGVALGPTGLDKQARERVESGWEVQCFSKCVLGCVGPRLSQV